MAGKLSDLAALDDIGFVGIPNNSLSPEDAAFYAQKGEEARQQYYAKHRAENKSCGKEHNIFIERFTNVRAPVKQMAYA